MDCRRKDHINQRKGFRVNKITYRRLAKRKRRIRNRLDNMSREDRGTPVFSAKNIQYELAERGGGVGCGGIGLMHMLVGRTGLAEAIDRELHLLKMHRPYPESDHVLNIAYNILAGGTCLEHLELLRTNEHYLVAGEDRRVGESAVRPGEPQRTIAQRGACVAGAGGQPGEQLGVYGDGVAGVDAEGVAGVVAAGEGALEGPAPSREAVGATDGVQDVPERIDATAVSDCADGPADRVPLAVVESVAACIRSGGGGDADAAAVLSEAERHRGTDAPIRVALGGRSERRNDHNSTPNHAADDGQLVPAPSRQTRTDPNALFRIACLRSSPKFRLLSGVILP